MTDPGSRDSSGSVGLLLFLHDIAHGARGGWSPRNVLLGFVGTLPVYCLGRFLQGSDESALVWLAGGVGTLVAAVLATVALAMVAGAAGWEYARGCHFTIGESLTLVRSRARNLLCSVFSLPCAVLLFVLIIAAGTWFFGLFAKFLAVVWLVVVGFPLSLFAAALVLLGAPALLLMLPASVLDCREAFDTVSRAMSYVRSRPVRFASGLLVGIAGALASAVVFAGFVTIVYALLVGPYLWTVEHKSIGEALAQSLARALEGFDPLWPFWDCASTLSEAADGLTGVSSQLHAATGRLVSASFVAALMSSMARLYLLLRWEIDRDPPASLIKAQETFEWSD